MSTEDWAKPKNARFMARRWQTGWAVFDPLGRKVSGVEKDRAAADQRADALQREADDKVRRGPRPCLCCRREFVSEGAHNRLCGNCRHADAGPVAMAWARPQRRGEGGRA
ncbi:MAG: hypothetical protein ACK4L4_19165 [Gemmobacter sp.]